MQYSTVQYSTEQCSTVQCSTEQYSTVQYSTIQYNTVHYSAVHYSTVQYRDISEISSLPSFYTGRQWPSICKPSQCGKLGICLNTELKKGKSLLDTYFSIYSITTAFIKITAKLQFTSVGIIFTKSLFRNVCVAKGYPHDS